MAAMRMSLSSGLPKMGMPAMRAARNEAPTPEMSNHKRSRPTSSEKSSGAIVKRESIIQT